MGGLWSGKMQAQAKNYPGPIILAELGRCLGHHQQQVPQAAEREHGRSDRGGGSSRVGCRRRVRRGGLGGGGGGLGGAGLAALLIKGAEFGGGVVVEHVVGEHEGVGGGAERNERLDDGAGVRAPPVGRLVEEGRAEAPEALVQHVVVGLPRDHLDEPVCDGCRA